MDKDKLMKTADIVNALVVCDYYPRIYLERVTSEEEEAFVRVYNRLLEELIDREVMEC